MKILLQNVLWLLSFVAYQYYCLSNDVTIGILTTEKDNQINLPLKSIMEIKNRVDQKAHYKYSAEQVSKYDSFEASKVLCNMLNSTEGVATVFGVESTTSAILQSICVHFEIPYIITSWRAPFTKEYKTVLNFFPEAELFARGLAAVVQSFQWNDFVIIYETEEGLIRMQEILKLQKFKEQGKKRNILVKQLGPGPDHRTLLKEIKELAEVNIILDCRTEYVIPILRQAVEIDVLNLLGNVFVTSLDAHTLDYSILNKTATNITTIRIFDSNSKEFNDSLASWSLKDSIPLDKATSFKKIKTETVLFHDALQHLTDSIEDLTFTSDTHTNPVTCNGGRKSKNGYLIATYMKEKKLSNKMLSKPLKFDENGNRIDFNLHVVEVMSNQEIAIWYANNNSIRLTRDFNAASDAAIANLQKIEVIVVSTLLEPFLMKKEEVDGVPYEGNDQYEGYSMDLIKEIAKDIGFKFVFHVGNYGPNKLDETKKKWTGLIGEIIERRAHLAISDLTVTPQRSEYVDFSTTFMSLGIGILYKKPEKGDVNMFAFLDPFSITVWIYTATLYLIVSVILYFVARMTPGDWENPHPCEENPEELENIWNIKNCMWLTLGAIMTQGSDILTKGISSRIAVSMWWFFSLIMANSYMANLTAFLTKNRMEPTIDNAEALSKQSKVKYGTVDGGATQDFFKTSNFSTYKRMWINMEASTPSVFEKTNKDGVNRVQTTPKAMYAFLMESTQIDYVIETKCDLRQVGDLLDKKSYGIAMPINAPYRTLINKAVLKLSEKGKLNELKNKWWKEKRKEPSCDTSEAKSEETDPDLELADVGGIFLVLGFGTAVAIVLGISEFLWNVRNICIEEHITYWEALKVEVKFACCIWIKKKKIKPVISESSSAGGSQKDERIDNKSLVQSILQSAGSFMNIGDM